jgi:transcriptional regulator with XRE-family HTH domain
MDEYLTKQGQRIKRARRFKLLSQAQLAEKLAAELGEDFGDHNKISRIEKGRQDITSRELHAFSMVLEQPTTWLQGVEDEGFDSNGAMGVYLSSLVAA